MKNIRCSLTPKQSAMNRVTQMQRFESFSDYCASSSDDGRIVPCLAELTAHIEDAVENALSETEGRELEKAIKAAKEELTFLAFLHLNVIGLVTEEERVLVLLVQLAEVQLELVIYSNVLKLSCGSENDLNLRSCWECFVATTECLVKQFYSLSGTVKYIEDRYFNGLSILFKSSRRLLEEIEDQLSEVVKLSNTLALPRPHNAPSVDLENWHDAARRKSEWNSRNLIDMAIADTLSHLGDRSGAYRTSLRISERLRS